MKKTTSNSSVAEWLVDYVNTQGYRSGKVSGCKHPTKDVIFKDLGGVIGREDIIAQVKDLEKHGLIEVTWRSVNSDFSQITFNLANMSKLCEIIGVKEPLQEIEYFKKKVITNRSAINAEWLVSYYNDLLKSLERGTIPENVRDNNIFLILNAISRLEDDVWMRKFSSDILNNSKTFEKEYKNRVLTILRNKSSSEYEEMPDEVLLSQYHIMTYSQTLEFKGDITYRIQSDNNMLADSVIDTGAMTYGTIINSQTLSHAEPVSLKKVKTVMTIENKANYENMIYDPEILYIYTHGFMSYKERVFLNNLERIADENVRFYHWSDLDYGGMRIYQFMKSNVFSKCLPYKMDKMTYMSELESGIKVKPEKLEKIKAMNIPELEELKQCIVQYGVEIEQETLI